MNPERLTILQDLSKGSEIYIEGSERRPEAINLDALMRSAQAGQESSDWEVYAKKKIGKDITLLKKFTPDGKVSVILDLRGKLSISEYDLEAGKRFLGEGYLQVSRFSSPIEVTVSAVSLIRNKDSQNPQINGSNNLSNEFKQMLEKISDGEIPSVVADNEVQAVEIPPDEAVSDLEEQAEDAEQVEEQEDTGPKDNTEIVPSVLPEDDQLTLDSLIESPEATDSPEVSNLAVATTVFVEEMRKERMENERRISEIQEGHKKEIEEINARYAEQITESNRIHEERIRELTDRIEGLEVENATLKAAIAQQKQDLENKFVELGISGISGEIVSVGYSEVEIYTSNIESNPTVKSPEIERVADETLTKNERDKKGRYLKPNGKNWWIEEMEDAENRSDELTKELLLIHIDILSDKKVEFILNDENIDELDSVIISLPTSLEKQRKLFNDKYIRKLLINKSLSFDEKVIDLKRKIRNVLSRRHINISAEDFEKIKILIPQRLVIK